MSLKKAKDSSLKEIPTIGDVVWGKLGSYKWWPSIIIKSSDCGKSDPKLNYEWVFFFGDHKISQVLKTKIVKFVSSFSRLFEEVSGKLYKEGVFEALEILASRCNYSYENVQDLVFWAKNGFERLDGNCHFSDIPNTVLKFLNKVKKVNQQCEKSKNPPCLKRNLNDQVTNYIKGKTKTSTAGDTSIPASVIKSPIHALLENDIALKVLCDKGFLVEKHLLKPADEFDITLEELSAVRANLIYSSYLNIALASEEKCSESFFESFYKFVYKVDNSKLFEANIIFMFLSYKSIADEVILSRIYRFLEVDPQQIGDYFLWSNIPILRSSKFDNFRESYSKPVDEEKLLSFVFDSLKVYFEQNNEIV